jgi:DUF1365 family protein
MKKETVRNIEISLKALYEMYVGKEELLTDRDLIHLQIKQSFLTMEMILRILRDKVKVVEKD